jgi:hypothetical protein
MPGEIHAKNLSFILERNSLNIRKHGMGEKSLIWSINLTIYKMKC